MSRAIAVVLAAGKGTRMESELPKVLVEVCGRPMVEYVLDALEQASIEQVILVVGYRADDVRRTLAHRKNLTFVEQLEQNGTGHAVMMCVDELQDHQGPVLVITGDSPMVQSSSLKKLLEEFDRSKPACLMGTAMKEEPGSLGRIIRDELGNFEKIVEFKDATPEQQAVQEVNMSTYLFDCQELLWTLKLITNDNKQGEYYITDCPGISRSEGKTVLALDALQECESLSVNTVADLADVETKMIRMQKKT